MKTFTEELRYDYPLTPDSWVVDVGAHTGEFSRGIGYRYGCNVLGFEPIPEFWEQAIRNQTSKTEIEPVGIGDRFGMVDFKMKGNMTGEFAEGDIITVPIIPVDSLLRIGRIALLKVNIEGGEYALLERMLAIGMQELVDNIQVQFHGVIEDAEVRRDAIRERLRLTHSLTYDAPFIWENWERDQ